MRLTKNGLLSPIFNKKSRSSDEEKIKPASFRSMMRYATRTDWILLIIGLFCAALNGGLAVGILVLFGQLVDVIITGQSQYEGGGLDVGFKNELLNCCWIYYAAATLILLFGFPGVSLIHLVSERQVYRIKEKFLYQVLNQDITWLDKNDVGKLTQQMSAGIDRIQNGTGKTIALIVQAFVGLFCGVLIAFIVSWRVSIVMLIFLPLLIISIYGSGKVVKIMLRKETKAYEQAGSVAEEVLNGIRTVASFNAQDFELDRYGNHLNSGQKSGVKRAIWTAFFASMYNLVIFGSMAVTFWYGSNLALSGYTTPGKVQGIFWLFAIGSIRVGQAAPHLSSVTSAKLAAGELFATIDRVPEMDCASASGLKPVDVKGQISFQNLHFRYPSRPEITILNGVSFEVKNGNSVALVGHSGCGKSTIISLLMKFYQPEKGQITLDGRPIDELNVEWLRNSIGIVSQEPVIFAGSIEENLRMGKEDVTIEEMEEACKMANAEEFIKKLPKGYKTLIGDGNIRLSGGQKQRLAIARALVRNPKILLLDEATSALDNESEQIVQAAIDKISLELIIFIAHRLRTIKNSHNIIVFDHGKIVEAGNHEELMNSNGVYKQLVRAQEIEKAIQMEDATLSDADDVSHLQQPTSSKNGSLSRSKKIRRTLEYNSMYSACSSLGGAIQFEIELPEQLNKQSDDNDLITDEGEKIKPATLLNIFRFARPEKWLILGGLLLALLRGIAWPFYTVLLGKLFRSMANQSASYNQIASENTTTGLLFGGLAIYAALLTFLSGSMLGYTGEKLTSRLRLKVFRNLLSQDASFYDKPQNAVGKLTARLASDSPNVQAAFDQRLADVLQSFTAFSIGTIAGFYLDWRMAIVEFAVISFLLGIQLLILQYLKRRTVQDARIEEEAARIATEAIQNVKTVQALNRQHYLHQKFVDASLLPQKRSIQRGMLQAMTIALSTSIEEWNFGLVYTAAAYFISSGYVSPIIAFQVVSIVNAGIVMGFVPISYYVPELLRARMAAALIFKMIDAPTKIDNMSDQGLKPDFHGDIELKHAYFSYPNQKQLVLKDFNVKAYRGQTLALVGPSGCGKSTTIQLLERYYDTLSGSLKIDQHDIRDLNIRHLRQNMALVGQEPTLFNLTIEQNISYGMKDVTEAQVIEAAKNASIHDFIESLPKKYKTMVGARAAQLSGGQRQRLAIARAIIRDPKILLLDEATSALDVESEQLVQSALENASHGRTCICIAHRLSTVQHADVIAVVKDGRVIEKGSHQQLLNRKGLYYRLVQKHNN